MKIDVTKIEGYDKMTPEQKLSALEGFEIADPDYSGYVKKDVFDKTASELADSKKQLSAKLTEEEKAKAERDEALANLRKQVEEMQNEKQIANHKSQFLALGYDEKLATESAKAMVEGKSDVIFANHKSFIEAHDKALKASLMGGTPTPDKTGGNEGIMTLDKFRKLSAVERADFARENPDQYKELYKGE